MLVVKDAAVLKAEADKQEVLIVADARRQASILRGQGDAQSTSIFAAAYGRDPGFFDFYRSLQAMTTGLNGESTTYVGPPDGDFFRYFLKDTGPAAAPAQAGSPQALPVRRPVRASRFDRPTDHAGYCSVIARVRDATSKITIAHVAMANGDWMIPATRAPKRVFGGPLSGATKWNHADTSNTNRVSPSSAVAKA